ncbi:tetratricopeptide repeat protein [Candidatus Methylocalor cossyra]|uniref:Tetratricopeptide repeat protein n=1 Tax=Candidatus Methylocalor cossyra TaxID=3108543 RepID=A0ABM9NFY0_9GAMM
MSHHRAPTLPCLALALLAGLSPRPAPPAVPDAHQAVEALEREWAEIFYRLPKDQQAEQLRALLARAEDLVVRFPGAAEPLIMEAIVLCAYAAADPGLGALRRVERARELLIRSIAIDPRAMGGSAYITLGNLYYRLPGWPISYGNDRAARHYLETALKLFPDALDSNYFYGDFLLAQGEFQAALPYLEKADRIPLAPGTASLSELQLKESLRQALAEARARSRKRDDFFSRLLPGFGDGGGSP